MSEYQPVLGAMTPMRSEREIRRYLAAVRYWAELGEDAPVYADIVQMTMDGTPQIVLAAAGGKL